MNLIRSLLGRRQFLIAAFMTSTLGLVFKKLARVFDPGIQSNSAKGSVMHASDVKAAPSMSGPPGLKKESHRYNHLLSPLKIRNRILKNRMIHTQGFPDFLQGPEPWPSDNVREYYARFARSGAAIVVVPRVIVAEDVGKGKPWSPEGRYQASLRRTLLERWDTSNPAIENYFDQMVAAAHACGSLVCEI